VFTTPVRAHHFASLVVTPQGYKAGDRPCANLCPLAQTPIASSPPSMWLKGKRGGERSRNRGESCWAYRALLLLFFQTMAKKGWTR
jgi:hypothetical protein